MHPDLISLATRVLQRALEKSGHVAPQIYEPGEVPPPDDQLVDGLAGQLVSLVARLDLRLASPHVATGTVAPESERDGERLARLARALGACECWGEALSCSICRGRGAPGWRLPDRGEFEALVRPALAKVSRFRLAARNGHLQSPTP